MTPTRKQAMAALDAAFAAYLQMQYVNVVSNLWELYA
jgi:hypothetical protein